MVTRTARERLASSLGEVSEAGSFSVRRSAPVDDLDLEVRGVGRLHLPVTQAQARQLCRVGRPAHYGLGERTLLDRNVRDTWVIPKSRMKLDKRRWNKTLIPVLDKLREDLGLPAGRTLKAELHSMLVYERGQFFALHQDSERTDDMVASLVVTLPTVLKGGALVVEHGGEIATYRAPKSLLSLVAFYADCRHQVQPVRSGHRIALTYNLLLGGHEPEPLQPDAPRATIDAVARCLGEHFQLADGGEPPDRLVYLLDHEYTARGLSWSRLKGSDTGRSAILRQAVQESGCEVALAVADVHELWSCDEPDWGWRGHDRARRFGRWSDWDEDDDVDPWPEEGGSTEPDVGLDELIDWSVTLGEWRDASDGPAPPLAATTLDGEVCASMPSTQLRPYSSEYEGYMGNYGNTMDRWYHRWAVVVWPRRRDFAVRARGSPTWALQELSARLRAGDVAKAREMAGVLAPFWGEVAGAEGRGGVLTKSLRVAGALDDPPLAAMLLEPFRLETLSRGHARALAALVDAYGRTWASELVARWSARGRHHRSASGASSRAEWIDGLPRLCERLQDQGAAGALTGQFLLDHSWRWLTDEIESRRDLLPPSRRDEKLAGLNRAVLGVLRGAAVVTKRDVGDELLTVLCSESDDLLGCSIEVLRCAKVLSSERRAEAGVDLLARHCAQRLERHLARAPRPDHDWSVEPVGNCHCEICGSLAEFLGDPARRTFDWPLAKPGRQHVHGILEHGELPVLHQTRRTGRPYTLVLTKTEAVFEREREARRRNEADLTWIRRTWPT